ncbi:hypothetical protein BHM03_00042479, partial [Ensete ventricosum]
GTGSSFSQKDCPNPSCPLYATVATISVAALDGTSRAGGRRPFVGWLRALPLRPSRRQASPLTGWPRQPLVAAPAEGLAVAGHPCRGPGYG